MVGGSWGPTICSQKCATNVGEDEPPPWWKEAWKIEREEAAAELDARLATWSSSSGLGRMSTMKELD